MFTVISAGPIRRILALPCLVLTFYCSSTETRNSNELDRLLTQNCEESLAEFESRRDSSVFREETASMAGNITSIALTGGAAVTETIVYISGGIALGAVICSPIIALEVAADGRGDAGLQCVVQIGAEASRVIFQEADYSVSKQVWDSTESFRVKSYDQLAVYILDSVECHLERGTPQDLEAAAAQLNALDQDTSIGPYLSAFTINRKQDLQARLISLQNRNSSEIESQDSIIEPLKNRSP